ncbi:MAG TPA: hypothetical protein VFG63_06395 [Nocardioidaceae bacterium]|nr:hypothetical protein [Nocardioidaceae bacterium]
MNLDGTPDAEDLEFYDRYGPWEPLDPVALHQLMAGFPAPWWIVGGHAIEAFTGVVRPHEDIDLVVFSRHVPQLREHFRGRYHLWSNDGGTLRPLDDRFPEPFHDRCQVWVRENARSPWVIDCPLNPDVDGLWQSKRDDTHVAPLEDVTWVDRRGIRFLDPAIVLRYKATQNREKDRHDLDNTWPLLSLDQRQWLLDAVRAADPNHPWLERRADT